MNEAREKAVLKHNQLRSLHHDTPPMSLSDDLNQQVHCHDLS